MSVIEKEDYYIPGEIFEFWLEFANVDRDRDYAMLALLDGKQVEFKLNSQSESTLFTSMTKDTLHHIPLSIQMPETNNEHRF